MSELREWLGLTAADLLVYLAAAAIGGMYYVSNPAGDIALAVAGVVLSLLACPLGMKRDPEVSDFTNFVKKVAYPGCVLLAIAAIAAHYLWFK